MENDSCAFPLPLKSSTATRTKRRVLPLNIPMLVRLAAELRGLPLRGGGACVVPPLLTSGGTVRRRRLLGAQFAEACRPHRSPSFSKKQPTHSPSEGICLLTAAIKYLQNIYSKKSLYIQFSTHVYTAVLPKLAEDFTVTSENNCTDS